MGSELIPLINRVQHVLQTLGHDPISLPRIVVVGSQSTGKSSVLENLVGRDFLPRGADIVTRRPLILQLITMNADKRDGQSTEPAEYAVFDHKPDQIFSDFGQVRREIELETTRLVGQSKKISATPITLSIYSPYVLNLTLVDLPGITKVPVGDQPADIEQQVRNIVLEYARNPHAIILAVSAANVDLANSEALKLAREVDPEGVRTIGVITKVDLMDSGTNALDILCGRVVPLKIGYVAVVNRSQRDTQQGKGIRDSLRNEEEFFKTHPAYRTLAHRCGTAYLAKTLNKLLVHHIRERLPEIRRQLTELTKQTSEELATYGEPMATADESQRSRMLLSLLTGFDKHFIGSIDGSVHLQQTELAGGARINYIFVDVFARALADADPCAGLTLQEIRTVIRNSTGPRSTLFIPDQAFELLVKRQILRLAAPAQRCVELVFEELQRISAGTEAKLVRFPVLRARIAHEVETLLREGLAPAKKMVADLVEIELAFVNTNHPDFIGAAGAIAAIEQLRRMKEESERRPAVGQSAAASGAVGGARGDQRTRSSGSAAAAPSSSASGELNGVPSLPPRPFSSIMGFLGWQGQNAASASSAQSGASPARADLSLSAVEQRRPTDLTEKEEMEVELIRALIISYFGIVRKHVADLVPKTIMHHLINRTKEVLQNRLVAALYRPELIKELLQEEDNVEAERERCRVQLDIFRKALAIVNEVSE